MMNLQKILFFFALFTVFTLAFTSQVNAVNVTLETPTDNIWTKNFTIDFNYTPTVDLNFLNCSVLTNETGFWAVEDSNTTTITDDSINTIQHNFTEIGTYLWNVECYDDAIEINFSDANYTINIQGNDSIKAVRANTTDFIISSNEYIIGIDQDFNTTAANTNLSVWMETNLIKTSAGGSNEVFVRVNVSGVQVLEESLRSVSTNGFEGSAKMSPIIFNVSNGEHNITFEFRRTGAGNVEIDDTDFVLLSFETFSGTDIRVQNLSGITTFSNTAPFASIANWTISTAVTSEVFMFTKLTVNSSEANLPVFRLADVDETEFSATAARNVTSPTAIGSLGIAESEIEETGEHNHSIQGFVNVGSTTASYTIIDFDLREAANRTIQPFKARNNATNFTDFVTLGSGTHNIANTSVVMSNGTGFFVVGGASVHGLTSAQTSRLFFNVTGEDETSCFAQKHRSFIAGEVGNIGFITVCDGGLITGVNYTLNLWLEVESGRSVRLLDEFLDGFEIQPLNLSEVNLPPIANSFISPLNETSFGGDFNVSWNAFSDPNGDIVTYNLSLFNTDGSFNASLNSSTTLTNQLFNTSDFSDNTYLLVLEGCDPSDLCVNTTIIITITQLAQQIEFIFNCMNNGNLTECPGLKTIGDNTDPAPLMGLLALLAISAVFLWVAFNLNEKFGVFGQLFFGLLSFGFAVVALIIPALYSSNTVANEFMLNIYAIMQVLIQAAGLMLVALLTKFLLDIGASVVMKLGKR